MNELWKQILVSAVGAMVTGVIGRLFRMKRGGVYLLMAAIFISGMVIAILAWNRPAPAVSLNASLQDAAGNLVPLRDAPFQVRVHGVAANAGKHYVYLVVEDAAARWIEPGLGSNINGAFDGHCYLGEEAYPGKPTAYSVFAVVTNREYRSFDRLENGSILARSDAIELVRTH